MSDNQTTFEALGLSAPVLSALKNQGYETPTPIQAQAIPLIMAGRDLLGCAKTGTGKTAAFAIPAIEHLVKNQKKIPPRSARVLVLTPTRELAAQIDENFRLYGEGSGLNYALAFGGVGKIPQVRALARGVDVLVATPGRLLDLHQDGSVILNQVEIFVLDEADRMLDMGFIHDMKKIFALIPKQRQTLLFSATMPKTIEEIAQALLKTPEMIAVDPVSTPAEGVKLGLYQLDKNQKRSLLLHLFKSENVERALVFTRTKHVANRIAEFLSKEGIEAMAIHANKSQNHRTKALASFKDSKIRVLVATDIAARGIDIDELPFVINYEIPNEPETFIHRIGRTARAGASGTALSFCDETETPYIRGIEKLLGKSLPRLEVPANMPILPPPPKREPRAEGNGRKPRDGAKRDFGKTQERRPAAGRRPERPAQERVADRPPRDDSRRGDSRQDSRGPSFPQGERMSAAPRPGKPSGRPMNLDDVCGLSLSRPRSSVEETMPPSEERTVPSPKRDIPRDSQRGPRDNSGERQRSFTGNRGKPQYGSKDRKPSSDRNNIRTRQPLSDEEAAKKAMQDKNQPGIRPLPGDNNY